jgi:2-phosphoglycerate kinase
MIIHLNGMPGVGKLTIAKILAEELSARLIDNHAIVNIAHICAKHGSDEYLVMLAEIYLVVYKHLEKLPPSDIQIFTNCYANEYGPDPERFKNIEVLANKRKVPFVPVLLTCDKEEHFTRFVQPDRKPKQKATNPKDLEYALEHYTMIHPKDHPNAFALDVTKLSPKDSAEKIVSHIGSIAR